MKDFDRIVMVSPVGLEKDRILAGFKRFGANILYLIQSEKKEGSEKRLADTVRKFASDLRNSLKKMMEEIIIEETDITDLESCLRTLKEIIKKEIKKNVRTIYINTSTSSKIFAIASIYIAGLYPNLIIPFYVKTSNYLIQEFIEILNEDKLTENKEKLIDELTYIKKKFEESGWT
ncbi:MAG: DUF6293 family protein, partial [Promethearchaeia archaeon]